MLAVTFVLALLLSPVEVARLKLKLKSQRPDANTTLTKFVDQVYNDVVATSDQEALQKTCEMFGKVLESGETVWELGVDDQLWDCDTPALPSGSDKSESIQWRDILVQNYAYDLYHLIPVTAEDAMDLSTYKSSLLETLAPHKDKLMYDIQNHVPRRSLHYLIDDPDEQKFLKDYRWLRFVSYPPDGYDRRISINVPTPKRPQVAACIMEKLLVTRQIDQLKVAMIHAMGTEGSKVPLMPSDNVIMYLKKASNMDLVMSEAKACLDAEVGEFSRPGPFSMKRMGADSEPGANLYVAADTRKPDSKGLVLSYGARLGTYFGGGYKRMMTLDEPGAKDPHCIEQALCALGKALGAYKPVVIPFAQRMSKERFLEGLAGALRASGIKQGLDALKQGFM